ncbi:uncharacterized protein PV07_04115 [Cladophialophora immunda]|uniref:DUF7702 domain-containing protein n=1 Tax=Cladophialophora immunda TaxID=569365 RepID=A0A0D2CRM1_9EURO|nr:uncharacterized protein PV07_04115 [Cladophialophora immunda]KIW32585.1 hypothetical protein PV07_04115 [Cladophialophora immunda]OQU98941.1 hypothetical protein CLAIMM_04650 [Cladophialophora immunda]
MGTVTYRDGIAILQLIIFPCILTAALFIWSRTGWRVGSKIWRFPVTLSLIRIAGSICSLLTISHDSYNVEVAVAVCELIGIAPLLLTYIGLLRQIDARQTMNPKFLNLVAIICVIGLILGIAGVSTADDNESTYHANTIVKVSMALFLAVFVVVLLMAVWLYFQLRHTLRAFQKKLFLAAALSCPFLLTRLIYSAVADYTDSSRFAILTGNPTIYLCMDVLEEIIAMVIVMILGMSAVLERDYIKPTPVRMSSDPEVDDA